MADSTHPQQCVPQLPYMLMQKPARQLTAELLAKHPYSQKAYEYCMKVNPTDALTCTHFTMNICAIEPRSSASCPAHELLPPSCPRPTGPKTRT